MIKLTRPAWKGLSLKLRLTLLFLAVALAVWLAAGLLSWRESREQLDEFFDSYQLLLAHQLASADWRGFSPRSEPELLSPLERLEEAAEAAGRDEDDFIGQADDDALSFAVFDQAGRLIFSDGDQGREFSFEADTSGFVNRKSGRGKKWRLVWVKSPDRGTTIAVGQRLDYRAEAALELAGQLLWPWLAGLLFLAGATVWLVGRELRPLKKIAGELNRRAPDELTPLSLAGLPPEVVPLGRALNEVFQRLELLLRRERAFVADAAHELRTPLAALKVQAEVAQLAHDEPGPRDEALTKLTAGIDRTARLVEQLLALSRIDGLDRAGEASPLDWSRLIEEAIIQTEISKKQRISYAIRRQPSLSAGRPLLIGLMLRNLLDNARRYSPAGADIDIVLDGPLLTVTNSGAAVDERDLGRLTERFFRPPGQTAAGSGLGLSIVARVAELHGLSLSFQNLPPDRFSVRLLKSAG